MILENIMKLYKFVVVGCVVFFVVCMYDDDKKEEVVILFFVFIFSVSVIFEIDLSGK